MLSMIAVAVAGFAMMPFIGYAETIVAIPVTAKNGMVCVGNPTAASANGVVLIRINKG